MRSVRIGALSPLLRSVAEETLLQMEAECAHSLVCAFNCCVRALHVSPVFLSLVCVVLLLVVDGEKSYFLLNTCTAFTSVCLPDQH
jgi:hypothetical protein